MASKIKVVCLNNKRMYSSAVAAANHLKVPVSSIYAVCRGERKQVHGRWEFQYIRKVV